MIENAMVGAANAAQKSGILKALLHPSAKVIGDYWGKQTQEWLDRREERQIKNLEKHVAAVKSSTNMDPPQREPNERQFNALVNWTQEAQQVDPDMEPELAAMWQSLLQKIITNSSDSEELAGIIKEMTPADARIFLDTQPYVQYGRVSSVLKIFMFGRHTVPQRYADRFKRWGLVESRLSPPKIARVLLLLIVIILSGLLASQIKYFIPNFESSDSTIFLPYYAFGCSIIMALLLVVGVVFDIGRYELTDLGFQLRSSAAKFLATVNSAKDRNDEAPNSAVEPSSSDEASLNTKTRRRRKIKNSS